MSFCTRGLVHSAVCGLLLAGLPGFGGAPLAAQEAQQTGIDASNLARIRVVAVRAIISIRGGDENRVTTSATLETGLLARGCSARDRAAFAIRSRVEGSDVQLESTGVGERCSVKWEVTVPRRFAVDIALKSGAGHVTGVSAGVSFEGGAASLAATLPGGPVSATTSVGDVTVALDNDNVGTIRLSSDVGTIALWMAGRKLSHQGAPGAGDRLTFTGPGAGSLVLTTGVGRVEARIGESRAGAVVGPAPSLGEPVPLVVSTDWLAAHLHDPEVVVIQLVSRDADRVAVTIPGARVLSYPSFKVNVGESSTELPPADLIRHLFESLGVSDRSHVVFTGPPLVVTRAIFTLDFIGFARASGLDGGVTKWQAEGRSTAEPVKAPHRGTLTESGTHPEIVVTTDWVLSNKTRPGIALIDTRTAAEYDGTDGAGGHIEGARRLEWQEMFRDPAEFSPKDRATLVRLWRERAAPGDTVIAYCRVGYRASGTYFVSRLLGVPVKLYDGSDEAWHARQLPLVKNTTPLRNP
jgi:thiosulfate/3-mercaptopyruvate sulfurtransferase